MPAERLVDFEFEYGGLMFHCSVGPLRPSDQEAWWWVALSGDERAGKRYAPFRREARDSRASVQARVIAWYEEKIATDARPPRSFWQRRDDAKKEAAAPAADAPGTPAS